MVKATGTSPHVQHNDRKPKNPATVYDHTDRTKPPTTSSDLLYILELSADNEQNPGQNDESATILDLSKNALEKLRSSAARENERAEEAGEEVRPSDETRRLTRRLVAARSPDEVQSVLAETYDHMREWLALAATGDKEALAVVRRLSRLVSRGNRKIRDLNKEHVMRQRQEKAEEAEKKQLAQRLRNELKQAEQLRKQRERRYLQERYNDNEDEPAEFGPSMAETDAKIRALAAAMAALNPSSTDFGEAGFSDGMVMGDSSIENSDASGGDLSE